MNLHLIQIINLILLIITCVQSLLIVSFYVLVKKFRSAFTLLISILFSLMSVTLFVQIFKFIFQIFNLKMPFAGCFLILFCNHVFTMFYAIILDIILIIQLLVERNPYLKSRLWSKKFSCYASLFTGLVCSFLWILPYFFNPNFFSKLHNGVCNNPYLFNKFSLYRAMIFLLFILTYIILVIAINVQNYKRTTSSSNNGLAKIISFRERINIVYLLSIPLIFSNLPYIALYTVNFFTSLCLLTVTTFLDSLFYISCISLGFIMLSFNPIYKRAVKEVVSRLRKH